ncbi:outer membrane beta-barrel protein [Photobacterium rosenbergii]|nr:outer membrane beta-barrel protein [Photobacterium rosenbergii]
MKKMMTSAVIMATMAATPALAMNTDWFVGAGVGYQDDKVKGNNASNGEDANIQLRGGAILNDRHRVMGTYGYADKNDQHLFLASYDYLLPVHDRVNLVAGVSVGAADNKLNGKSSTDFVWGGQVGAMYEIDRNWSTEITYRYLDQDYSEKGTDIDYTQQVVWSVDYRF